MRFFVLVMSFSLIYFSGCSEPSQPEKPTATATKAETVEKAKSGLVEETTPL